MPGFTNENRFGIEFAAEVVRADGNVRNLAWRICNAKKVLVRMVVRQISSTGRPLSNHLVEGTL